MREYFTIFLIVVANAIENMISDTSGVFTAIDHDKKVRVMSLFAYLKKACPNIVCRKSRLGG